jgi:hypothetical protein
MQPLAVYQLLQQQPFRPLRVYRKGGQTHDITLRELAVVGVDYLDVGTQAPDYPPGSMSWFVTVPLEEIERLEPISPAETARNP